MSSPDEEAAIQRARDLFGPAAMTSQVAQRDLRSFRRFCLWGLAVLEVFVMVASFGLHGHVAIGAARHPAAT